MLRRYAATTPGNAACAMASPMNAIPRSTTKVPTTAHTTPTSASATSARMKNASPTGASAGIGRACAMRFAREGARLVLTDVQVDAGEALAREIEERGGTACFVR